MKSTARLITTYLGGAALILAAASLAEARQASPDPAKKQTQTQAKKSDGDGPKKGQAQATKPARARRTARVRPGPEAPVRDASPVLAPGTSVDQDRLPATDRA